MATVQKKPTCIPYRGARSGKAHLQRAYWWPRFRLSFLDSVFRARTIVLRQSPRVQKAIQVSVAVMAMLLAFVVGPETHVHQGEGPNRETVVHIHFGFVGHTHDGIPSESGPSLREASGPAVYLNAFNSIETHAAAVPILIPQPIRLSAPAFTAEVTFSEPAVNAHAPPLIDSTRPRPPPLAFLA